MGAAGVFAVATCGAGLPAVAICEAGAEAGAATGVLLTTVRAGPAGASGDAPENAGPGIGIVRVGCARNGSERPGRFGVTPGESRCMMCGVIITTSSVVFFL